jgi:hypothetical protein
MMFNDPPLGSASGISVRQLVMIATVSFTFFSVCVRRVGPSRNDGGGITPTPRIRLRPHHRLGTAVGIAAAYMLFSVG